VFESMHSLSVTFGPAFGRELCRVCRAEEPPDRECEGWLLRHEDTALGRHFQSEARVAAGIGKGTVPPWKRGGVGSCREPTAAERVPEPRQRRHQGVRYLLFSPAEPPDRVRSEHPFRLVLVVPFAEKAEIINRARAAPRVGHDVIDLEVLCRVAALAG